MRRPTYKVALVIFSALEASFHGRFCARLLTALVVAATLSGQAPGSHRAPSPMPKHEPSVPHPSGNAPSGTVGPHPAESEQAESTNAAPGFALTVRVSQLRNDHGSVAVAVFASPSDFPDQKRALTGQVVKIEKGRAAATFTGLKPGLYAVAVLHDENDNAKMDFNFLGMPLEGYGFSNDASAPFGPPSFEAAAFKLTPRPSYIPVKVRYFF